MELLSKMDPYCLVYLRDQLKTKDKKGEANLIHKTRV